MRLLPIISAVTTWIQARGISSLDYWNIVLTGLSASTVTTLKSLLSTTRNNPLKIIADHDSLALRTSIWLLISLIFQSLSLHSPVTCDCICYTSTCSPWPPLSFENTLGWWHHLFPLCSLSRYSHGELLASFTILFTCCFLIEPYPYYHFKNCNPHYHSESPLPCPIFKVSSP